MKNNQQIKTQIKTLIFLLIILLSSVFFMFPMNISDSTPDSDEINDDNNNEIDIEPVTIESDEDPELSDALWWSLDYKYRKLINITNNADFNLEKYGVSISFNYTELVLQGKMKSNLKDIRIVENGAVQKYYFKKDYPQKDYVTVWFDTDINANTVDTDTYLYYNNPSAEIDETYFMNESSSSSADSFGWIRNGDFELDNKTGKNINNIFGWTWSDDVMNDVYQNQEASNIGPYNLYQNNLSTYYNPSEMERTSGEFSFKWGDIRHTLPHDAHNGGAHDYAGTLFSYPFTVPKVNNGGISLKVYRNIRMWDHNSYNRFGYFMCLTNVNSYNQTEVDKHDPIFFKEDYRTLGRRIGWWGNVWELESSAQKYIGDGADTVNTYLDELTGEITIDLTNYEGLTLFLETGMFYPERTTFCAFGQIDNVKFSYDNDITAILNEGEIQKSDIIIITRDVDDRIVSNAEVSLVQGDIVLNIKNTSVTEGSLIFTGNEIGDYNITVNYTLNSGIEAVVYNSSEYDFTVGGPREFNIIGAIQTFEIILNMSTIDFEIVDQGENLLEYGYIRVKNDQDGNVLATLPLDNGKATFRWKNQSRYYFEVYYNDLKYNLNPRLLNASYVYRSNYVKDGEKFQDHTLFVNESNIDGRPNHFTVNKSIYTNGSMTELGNKKIIKANITLTDMVEHLEEVSIFYIDKDNSIDGNLIYYNDTYISQQSDSIRIDIRNPPLECDNLKEDAYEVYGLFISVIGQNNSVPCHGIIKINLTETWNVYNKTNLAKLNVQVISQTDDSPVGGVKVLINSTIKGELLNIDLLTFYNSSDENDPKNGYVSILYLIGYKYNISLSFHEYYEFEVNRTTPPQWKPIGDVTSYNYTFEIDNSTIKLRLNMHGIDPNAFQSRLEELSLNISVIWGQNVTVQVYCNSTTDNWNSWDPLNYPDIELICTVMNTGSESKIWLTLDMQQGQFDGWFIVRFNSTYLSAGFLYGEVYIVIISGVAIQYINPSEVSDSFNVETVPTNLTIHNYDTLQEISDISQYFGEMINITIDFSTLNGISLTPDATLTYNWLNIGPTQFYADPINIGYYTFTINTSIAGSVGLKSIRISASKENYTRQVNILFELRILERLTAINNHTGFYYFSQGIWVKDAHNFTFEYRDIRLNQTIGDLNVFSYSWQRTDSSGVPIGNSGIENLIVTSNQLYVLDFDTEKQSIGYYMFFITMHKDNYELRTAVFHLEIKIRLLEADFDATNLEDDLISVVKGEDVDFEVTLKDNSRGGIPLSGATVTIEIGDKEYDMDEEEPGVYRYTFKTEDVDAYFTSKTYTITIKIEKLDFEEHEIEATLVVQMEEIFPGIPTFYFVMVVSAISAVVGAVVAYKVIQIVRIPKFIKRVRAMKKAIKAKKEISESILTDTKDKLILKRFEDDWNRVGLSLRDILGVKEKAVIPKESKKFSLKMKGGKE